MAGFIAVEGLGGRLHVSSKRFFCTGLDCCWLLFGGLLITGLLVAGLLVGAGCLFTSPAPLFDPASLSSTEVRSAHIFGVERCCSSARMSLSVT